MNRRPRCGPRPNGRARRCPCPGPWCGVRADRRSPMRIDSGFVEPFDFAAVGARSPTSRARVLEVRIQSPPAVSQVNLRIAPLARPDLVERKAGGVFRKLRQRGLVRADRKTRVRAQQWVAAQVGLGRFAGLSRRIVDQGNPACWGKSSVISNHDALLPTKV